MSTRQTIRRRAVILSRTRGRVAVNGITALTATGGDANSLIDTTAHAAPPVPTSASRYRNWSLYIPEATNALDTERAIAEFDAEQRRYMINGPAYNTVPGSGDRYEILRDPPDDWNSAINEANKTLLWTPRLDEWTPASNDQRIYTFGTAPLDGITDLARRTQVFELEFHPTADASGEENWQVWADGQHTYRTYEDEGTLRVVFGGLLPNTDHEMRFTTLIPFAALTDETTILTVDEEWAAWATLKIMAGWFADADNPSDEWTAIGETAEENYHDLRRAVLADLAYRTVGRHSQMGGSVSVGGRRGGRF